MARFTRKDQLQIQRWLLEDKKYLSGGAFSTAPQPTRQPFAATRNYDGTFPQGVSGNPKGRPRGRRNRGYVVITSKAVDRILDLLADSGVDLADILDRLAQRSEE